MTVFLFICTLMHLLPSEILNELGQLSDVVSDMSPEILRGIEHIVFTMLLN